MEQAIKNKGVWAAALAGLLAASAAPAAAASDRFTEMQFNSTATELRQLMDRLNSLTDDLSHERDFTRGCRLLGQAISMQKDGQILAERLAGYARQLGFGDGEEEAVRVHNMLLENRHAKEADYARLCQGS